MSLISVDQGTQRPTHARLHIRDAHDAHVVLEAVRKGLLQPIKRRLNGLERGMNIQSGAIFVWEESDDEKGLRRWTDSRLWSQSRMREVSDRAFVQCWCLKLMLSDSLFCSTTKDYPMNVMARTTSKHPRIDWHSIMLTGRPHLFLVDRPAIVSSMVLLVRYRHLQWRITIEAITIQRDWLSKHIQPEFCCLPTRNLENDISPHTFHTKTWSTFQLSTRTPYCGG